MSDEPIEAVIFDLWYTLVRKPFSVKERLRDHFGIERPFSYGKASPVHDEYPRTYEEALQLSPQLTTPEIIAIYFLGAFHIPATEQNIHYVADTLRESLIGTGERPGSQPITGVHQMLEHLHRKGYRLALLSNASPYEVLQPSWDLDQFFEPNCVIYSWMVGYVKPDEHMWHRATTELGVPPNRTLVVDDQERHIHVARQLGYQVATFTGIGELMCRFGE